MPRPLRSALPLLAATLLVACQATPAPIAPVIPVAAAAEPWTMKPLPLAAEPRWTADPAAPRVEVKVDLAPLLRTLDGQRKLMGLGFQDTNWTKLVLKAEGPGIASDSPVKAEFSGRVTSLSQSTTLSVPVGHNRLYTLEAQDANGIVIARLRTLGDVAQSGNLTLTFNFNTDAAARVLDDFYHRVDLNVTANKTYVDSLANTDITAALLSYVAHFTGYTSTDNTFSLYNPLYFKDWVVATSLIAGTLTSTSLGTNTNPGGTGDVAVEYRPTVVFFPAADDSMNGATIEVLDPVNRGSGANAVTLGAVGSSTVMRSVPPGRWTVRITKNTVAMTTEMYVPYDSTTTAFNVQLPTYASGVSANALSVVARTNLAAPAPTSVALPYGTVTTVAGSSAGTNNGTLDASTFDNPISLAWVGDATTDALAIVDATDSVRKLTSSGVERFIGFHSDNLPPPDGTAALNFNFKKLGGVAFANNNYYVTDYGSACVFKFAGSGLTSTKVVFMNPNLPREIAVRPSDNVLFMTTTAASNTASGASYRYNALATGDLGYYTTGTTPAPSGIAVAGNSGPIYFTRGHAIFKVDSDLSEDPVRVAGSESVSGEANGSTTEARFNSPTSLAVSSDGKRIWVADTGNNQIRAIEADPYTGTFMVKKLAGGAAADAVGTADGIAGNARFSGPRGLAFDGRGHLYVADSGNNRIRKIQVN